MSRRKVEIGFNHSAAYNEIDKQKIVDDILGNAEKGIAADPSATPEEIEWAEKTRDRINGTTIPPKPITMPEPPTTTENNKTMIINYTIINSINSNNTTINENCILKFIKLIKSVLTKFL